MIDLIDEWLAATSRKNGSIAERISAQFGLRRNMTFPLPGCCVGAAQIEIAGDRYQPAPGGPWALLVVSDLEENGEPLDICAFFPRHPERIFSRIGVAKWLGQWNVAMRRLSWPQDYFPPIMQASDFSNEALDISGSALEYIRSGGSTAVPVDVQAYIDLRLLRDSIEVHCDSAGLARAIYDTLTRPYPDVPTILHPRGVAA